MVKETKRPSSTDRDWPHSIKFGRPPSTTSSKSSILPSTTKSPKSSKPSLEDGALKKKPLLKVKPRAFSASVSPKSTQGSSPTRDSPKESRPHRPCPRVSPHSTSSSTSLAFKKWGAPYAQTNKNSTRSCSPDLTIVSLEDDSAFSQIKTLKKSLHPSTKAQKCIDSSNPATKHLMQVTLCATNARAPVLEVKARKPVFYKNTDKESLIAELESLKVAVADQTYHLQLHKTYLFSLREEHKSHTTLTIMLEETPQSCSQLEEKVRVKESIDGSNAPRTGGEGRLFSKIAGMQMKISNLEDDITKYQEKIQNLKYRYQVTLTREATIQRNIAAGDVWRLQKEVRNAKDVLQTLTKQSRKFLHLRGKIIPNLQQSISKKQKELKGITLSIRELEKLSKQCTDESYGHKKAVSKAKSRATSLYDEGKKIRAKLKQERERKRKTQQDVWILGYETCMLEKENRVNAKRRQIKEAAMAREAPKADTMAERKGNRS